jgi:RimJ/RimL family protein N-acetyltransferase
VLIFERTHDLALVRQILTDPVVWPHVGDDFAPPREEWTPNDDPRIWYVLAIEGALPVGLFTFLPRSTVLWEVHVAFSRERRSRGVNIAAGALAWMFENSTAERIIAEIPECNRLAVRLADKAMRRFAVNEKSFKKGGALRDLVLFGLSKGEYICRA